MITSEYCTLRCGALSNIARMFAADCCGCKISSLIKWTLATKMFDQFPELRKPRNKTQPCQQQQHRTHTHKKVALEGSSNTGQQLESSGSAGGCWWPG